MNARRSLVEAELVSSVGWMIELRWIAGAGVLLATWVVENLFRLDAAEWPLYAIGLTILAYNLVFYLHERRLNRKAAPISAYYRLAKWQVALDWLAITLLIYFSGGIESPVIFFFFFHIIIASILFPPRTAFGFTLLAIVLLTGTALLEYFGILPHSPIGGFLQSPLYQNSLYVSAMLLFFSSTALITAYLATSIQERLRAREEDVVNLSESLQRATVRLQALNEGARIVGSTLELAQVFNRLVRTTAEAMGVQACTIRLLDQSGQRLEPVAVYGLSQTYLNKGPVEVESNALARQVLSGNIVNVPDVISSPLIQYPEEAKQEGIRSMLSAPLANMEGPLGILRAYSIEPNRFTADDEAFLAAIAAQGSIAIENALAYQAVAALEQSKSQFVRMVTHELRSPVSVIRSLLRTLTGGFAGGLTSQQQDILERAAHRAEFLQGLIDDLLDMAAGKADVRDRENPEPVALRASLEKIITRFEVSAREKDIQLEWIDKSGNDPLTVLGTKDAIDRIFNNLVSNAVKYTPPEGKVTVRLARVSAEAQITVEDTGIGIPEDAMQHLFEEFFRAPNAKEMEREGTGLGLTIVKDLITRLGGHVSVKSTQNVGSQFTVTLPIHLDESRQDAGEAKDQPQNAMA
jgi:signal transduction histidine kinase